MNSLPIETTLPRIAVIIPCYRVKDSIVAVITGLPAWIDRIIVVDDACPELSTELVATILDTRISLIHHKANQGVGGAMLTGMRCAIDDGCEIIVKMDGDGQMDPRFLRDLCYPIATGMCDFTKGNRFVHLSNLQSMPILRRLGNVGLTFLTKFASGQWHISDPTNGYFAIHREAANLLNSDAVSRRYFFEISLLIQLNILRAVTLDIPIPARYDGERSSLSIMHCLFSFPPRLLWGFLNRFVWRYCFYDVNATTFCSIAGLLLTTFGASFGLYRWILGAHFGQIQTSGTVAISLLSTIVGVQLLLQALVLDVVSQPSLPISRLLGSRSRNCLGSSVT